MLFHQSILSTIEKALCFAFLAIVFAASSLRDYADAGAVFLLVLALAFVVLPIVIWAIVRCVWFLARRDARRASGFIAVLVLAVPCYAAGQVVGDRIATAHFTAVAQAEIDAAKHGERIVHDCPDEVVVSDGPPYAVTIHLGGLLLVASSAIVYDEADSNDVRETARVIGLGSDAGCEADARRIGPRVFLVSEGC